MKNLIIIILTLIITGCCSIDPKDIEFNNSELAHFSEYQKEDTIYFKSNLGNIDTITIVGYESEKYDQCGGFMARLPQNTKWIKIKHLPIDKWHGTTQDMTNGGEIEIDYQGLLWITKYPISKTTEYSINFKDFHSSQNEQIGAFYTDTLTLNNIILTNYYIVKHGYPERVTEPENVETVYWTNANGLTAYKNKNGELWTKEKAANTVYSK